MPPYSSVSVYSCLFALIILGNADGELTCENSETCSFGELLAEAGEQAEVTKMHTELLQRDRQISRGIGSRREGGDPYHRREANRKQSRTGGRAYHHRSGNRGHGPRSSSAQDTSKFGGMLLEQRDKAREHESPARTAYTAAKAYVAVLPALAAAAKLGLFDVLSSWSQQGRKGLFLHELASKLKVSVKGLDALLISLVAFGFVFQDPDKKLSCMPHGGLTESDLAWLLGWEVSTQRQFYYIAESVREGRAVGLTETFGNFSSLYEARAELPEVAQYWDPFMQIMNKRFVFKLDDLVSFWDGQEKVHQKAFSMLDWCGNTGYNALEVAKRFPSAHVTVLDLPEQCEKAEAAIEAEGMKNRVDTSPADLSITSFSLAPAKYDMVLMTHTIREWSGTDVQRFFRIVYQALNEGGVVLVDMTSSRKQGEYSSVPSFDINVEAMPLYFLEASHVQHEHYWADVVQWLRNAGFEEVRTSPIMAKRQASPNRHMSMSQEKERHALANKNIDEKDEGTTAAVSELPSEWPDKVQLSSLA